MDTTQSVRELMQSVGVAHLCESDDQVDFALIERLKGEIDVQVRSDIQRAVKLGELAYTLSLRLQDPLARALGLRARAQTLHYDGKYEEAIGFYRQASTLYVSHEMPVDAARIHRSMIDPLMYLGRYDDALALADKAREIFIEYDEKILLAQLETNVGNIYHRTDQYHRALDCYNKAKFVFSQANDLSSLAIVTLNSANIYSNLDKFRESQLAYQQAYDLSCEQKMGLIAARAKYNLGYLHFLKGEYHQALREWHDGLSRFAELGDERHVALCYLDLAEAYLQLNVLDEAARMASEARARFLKLANCYESAKAQTWLGLAFLQQGKLDEAEEILLQAQEEFRTEENEVYLGSLKLYLADLYLRRNDHETALCFATEARDLFSNLGLKARTCSARLVLASVLKSKEELSKAEDECHEIVLASEDLDAPWIKYQVRELLGDILLSQGNLHEAYQNYLHAVSFVEHIRGRIRVDEFRGAFFKDKLRVYEKLIRLCLQQGGTEKESEAFYYLESRKARTLVDLLINELEFAPANDGSSISELRERWRNLREELHWFYNKANQLEVNKDTRHLAMDGKILQEISVRENALVDLVRQAQIQDAEFARLNSDSGMRVSDLQSILAEDEAVIEYYFDDEDLKIFVVDRKQLKVIDSPFGREELNALTQELKFQFEKFQYGRSYVSAHQQLLLRSVNGCLIELHKALIAPALNYLSSANIRKLIFVPFDQLHNIPFQSLYDGREYLWDQYEIAYAPSARLFAHSARKTARPPWVDCGRVLIFGAADEAAPKITQEIEAIQRVLPGSICFSGEDAQLDALKEHMPQSDVIHIASHAVFRQDNPMFSAFKLAGQWLNFYDICSLRIPSSLVTLSGCSTGVNQVYAGDEMHGLVRGFLTAGASALVVSLWPVSDTATANLMSSFYKHLTDGLPPRSALRQAALEVKKDYAHPYYWAPFIFIGHS